MLVLVGEYGEMVTADGWTTDRAAALRFTDRVEAERFRRTRPGTTLWMVEIDASYAEDRWIDREEG